MKIFLPFKKDLNPYLDEIERFSMFEFVYSHYTCFNDTYKIVSIHWPEAIFDWLEPTDTQLVALEKEIGKWKRSAKIIYTLHDERRHKGMTSSFSRLFDIVERNADIFIHLGEYSKRIYEKTYPEAFHKIIFHPIYENSYIKVDKYIARKNLGIDKKAIVFTIPGHIRNRKEKNLVLKSFNKLHLDNKVLIATRMRNEMEFDFRARVRLKRIFDIQNFIKTRFNKKYRPPVYIFKYQKSSAKEISMVMSASDIILIPRINSLNSGILFLGMTFNKLVLGPQIGNIKEHLDHLGYPTYDPRSYSSLLKSLKKAVNLYNDGFEVNQNLMKDFKPENISRQWDKTIKELL